MVAHVYKLADGTKVPGVTTILSRFKESGALMHWAWTQGKEGKDYRETRDKAANAGTVAHAMVEAHIKGFTFDPTPYDSETLKKAETAFGAFLEWATASHLKPVKSETSLVSEKHRFGGTLDTMLIHGKLAIGDWKTSGGVYSDMLAQVAAYGALWEENFPLETITGGYHILRFDKEYGDFNHHWYPELNDGWEYFKLVRQAYEFDKKLRKRAG
jgi:hypothetical protein